MHNRRVAVEWWSADLAVADHLHHLAACAQLALGRGPEGGSLHVARELDRWSLSQSFREIVCRARSSARQHHHGGAVREQPIALVLSELAYILRTHHSREPNPRAERQDSR